MGYTIFYNKAIIKIQTSVLREAQVVIDEGINDEFLYIPLALTGESNVRRLNFNNRYVADKDWGRLFHKKGILFTYEELSTLIKEMSMNEINKAKRKMFRDGEFEKWMQTGIKKALTIEEYSKYNDIYVNRYSIELEKLDTLVKTSMEFAEIFKNAQEACLLEVFEKGKSNLLENLNIYFGRIDIRKQSFKPKRKKEKQLVKEYFVISNPRGFVLVRKTRYGYKYTTDYSSSFAKTFKTEKEAQKYFDTNKDMFRVYENYSVKKINEERYI